MKKIIILIAIIILTLSIVGGIYFYSKREIDVNYINYNNPIAYVGVYSFDIDFGNSQVNKLDLFIPLPKEWNSQEGVNILSIVPNNYEIKDSNEHMKGTGEVYSGLKEMINKLRESIDETNKYKEEITKLKENISSLNNVYGNMLSSINLMTNV